MSNIQFWYMQMFPGGSPEFAEKVPYILEHHQFIGLGNWEENRNQISHFCDNMKVNDIVAIKNGRKLIALVQVIGGVYEVTDDPSELGWIIYRRPIRILDWEIEQSDLPQPRGTLNLCVSDDVETTQVIQNWYEKVERSFKERKLSIRV